MVQKIIAPPSAVHGGGRSGGGAKKLRLTGLFTLRRSSGSAYGFARSFRYAPFPRKTSGTFCPPCKPTVCLFGRPKRRKQPERYVQFLLKIFSQNILKKI
jgi:hypothetical protein